MKLTNSRNGWTVTGEFIAIIAAGIAPTDDEMLAYWHLVPGDARYADHVCALRYARVVLRKHNGNFMIVPLSKDINEVTQ